MPVSTSRVATSEACSRTVHRRVQQVQNLRETLGVNLEKELRALPKNERQDLLRGIALLIEIPPDHSLAMKANHSVSWSKLRTLRQYVEQKLFNARHLRTSLLHIHWQRKQLETTSLLRWFPLPSRQMEGEMRYEKLHLSMYPT